MIGIYFSAEEKAFFEIVLKDGLATTTGHNWWIVRFAIAQSMKIEGEPDARYRAPPGANRSELKMEQISGWAKVDGENYDDALRLLLGVHHDEDLFEDDRRYQELVQRHARRGLEAIKGSWASGRSFHDYLLDELYSGLTIGSSETEGAFSGALDYTALAQGLNQLGVSATQAAETAEGPRLSRFSLTLGAVEDYDRLKRGLDDLAFALGLGNTGIGLAKDAGERRVILEVPRPSAYWRQVAWPTVAQALSDRDELLPVSPGVDVLGVPFVFDLAEAPHLFVAGATGSGKSVCLNALLLSMVVSARPPQLLLIDPKGVDFADYDNYSKLWQGEVFSDRSKAVEVLREAVAEMDRRQELLRSNGVRNVAEANLAGMAIERIVIVIDELADFMLGRTGAEEPLIRLAQRARAMGIHLVLATQRPEAATFSGLLRANIPARIALTVQKSTDSRIILDEVGAERLLMRGDMLIKLPGRATIRAHGVNVSSSDVQAVIGSRTNK